MADGEKDEIAVLLGAMRNGDRDAAERLIPLVYDELRLLAHRRLRRSGRQGSLDTTALVHELYLKLVAPERIDWCDRAHFLAVAANAMRYIVVDYARRRSAERRGGGVRHTSLDGKKLGAESRAIEILALDQALERLASLDERLARVVELIFFGGLTEKEAGAVLGVSERTVRRDWRKARAVLSRLLAASPGAP